MSEFDVEKIKSDNPLLSVIGSRIELTKNGREWQALCPFHTEKTASFSVVPDKDFFHCFGCGKSGDALDFVMEFHGVDFVTACKVLGGEAEAPEDKGRKRRITKIEKTVYDGIEPVVPVPFDAPLMLPGKKTPQIFNPKRADDPKMAMATYTPSMAFAYKNAEGMLTGYVLRVDLSDGRKLTPAIMWCKYGEDKEGWCHYAFPEPRPLYGWHLLGLRPDAPALITEGEKCADAAHRLLPSYVPVTWSGGSSAVGKTDWLPLSGRTCLIWGDADAAGEKASLQIAAKAKDAGAHEVKIIGWDKEKPKGWDIADAEKEGLTKEEIVAWAKQHVYIWPPVVEAEPPIEVYDDVPGPEVETSGDENPYFRMLGHRKEFFYYYNLQTSSVIEFSVGQHTKTQLMYLAPLSYWEMTYPAKTSFDVDAAANSLMQRGKALPMFRGSDIVRGRGAWIDGENTVLHLGTKLNVDGKVMPLRDFHGLYLYDQDTDLNIPYATPATTKAAHKLVEICKNLSWENPLSALLLSGWCVIAPVCGILKWRPHIWVTGPSASGKTTVVKDIIGRVLGEMAIIIEGNTSEAGIRQTINKDARPIIYDESEPDVRNQSQHMSQILAMARVASSGGRVLKGTSGGEGLSYTIRSTFCFSSINTSIDSYADESRISKLVLWKDDRKEADERFKKLRDDMYSIFTATYSAEMLARSVVHLKTLQENCHTFVEAAARVLKSRRLADQLGTILAGAYLCHSTNVINLPDAIGWVSSHDWADHIAIDAKSDEIKLIDKISTHRARVYHSRGSQEVTIGELILCCHSGHDVGEINSDHAEAELRRYGIKVESDMVFIANKSDNLRKILAGTPWERDWGRPLKSLKGAEGADPMYFAPGITARATILPISLFNGGLSES